MPPSTGVVLLAGPGASTRIIYHALAARGMPPSVILEDPVPTRELLRRRITRLGVWTVAGQVAFAALVVPLLRREAGPRLAAILGDAGLSDAPIDGEVRRVPSVNSAVARETLAALAPRVVVLNGTRIVGAETLRAVDAPFVNVHAGMTPFYRGVHGGYWALAEGRPELAGVTVHYVDRGIDTGAIIAQVAIQPSVDDSFITYPYLQLAAGIPPLVDAVAALRIGGPVPGRATEARGTVLRTHPTIWQYLDSRWRRGVR